jgi:hypothetical protein
MLGCCGEMVRGCCELRLGGQSVRVFGCFGFIGRCANGLGGQEPGGQDSACGRDAAGDESADGEAAQERVSGGVLQRQAEGRVAEGGDLAGGEVGGADGLVRERRDPARHGCWDGGGEP